MLLWRIGRNDFIRLSISSLLGDFVKNVAFMWFYLTLSRVSRHMYPSLSSEFYFLVSFIGCSSFSAI
jgi:hypothetical protein